MVHNKSNQNQTQAKPSFVSSNEDKAASKKEFALSRLHASLISLTSLVLFAAYAMYALAAQKSDMLYQAQNFSFFNSTCEFFDQCMKSPGGLITWGAAYLTQFYYTPIVGASIQVLLWMITFFVAKKALRISSLWSSFLLIPFAASLISIIGVAYWLYYIKQEGYWFYGTIGFLVSMFMTWSAQISRNKWYRLGLTIAVAATFPLFGWYSFLASLYIALVQIADERSYAFSVVNKIVGLAVSVLSIVVVGVVCYYNYTGLSLSTIWFQGFPRFISDAMISWVPAIPFIATAILPAFIVFLPKDKSAKGLKAYFAIALFFIVFAACVVVTNNMNYSNYNYQAEMRMYRAVEEYDWDKVLDEMSSIPGDADREMVLFKNIALMNKGEMGNKMFKYNNMGDNPVNPHDTLHVFMMQTGGPLIYLHHAKTNFAIRWCIENMVEFGPSFSSLKILATCSLVNGEMETARKYLTLLQHTTFQKEWADHYMPIVDNPKLIKNYHELDNIIELRDHMGSVLDGDQGLCEMYLLSYFSNTINKDSKLLGELTLNYAMVQKDIQLFWPRFFLYASMHKGEDMPIHYQEAAYLYGNLEHTVDISSMPFDKEKVIDRYNGFQQLSQSLLSSGLDVKKVGENMKASYGDTFYWFYFFCRDIKSY